MSPRKKSPPKVKNPNLARKNSYFKTLMSTPEGRELRRQWSTKPRKNPGRPMGVPDGHTKETIAPIREQAKKDAKKVVKIMSDKYNIEDEYQKEALTTAATKECRSTPPPTAGLEGTRKNQSSKLKLYDVPPARPRTKKDKLEQLTITFPI